MLSKLTDTANILKAKITKDDLEEKLIQATTEQNWQTPTNILHEIAGAAFNYQKWQKISDFIWDKLKKKTTWRKVIKTLNLVDFLIRNGPPSAISSFKYDIYQFRAFSDFTLYEEGIDRGEAIRQKSKQIVELLSNEEHLEEEREKAKKIREKMSNVVGGSTYGSYSGGSHGGYGGGGDGRYESFNNKTYDGKTGSTSYGGGSDYGGLGVYGDYNYGKSTLDKYKNDQKPKKTDTPSINKPLIMPDITGAGSLDQGPDANKKPFQKIAKKLQKPGQKPLNVKPDPPSPAKNTNGNSKIAIDVDIFDTIEAQPQKVTPVAPPTQVVRPVNVASQPSPTQGFSNPQVQPSPQAPLFNQLYTPQPVQQPVFPGQMPFGQPINQPYMQPYNQPYGQPYGQPFGQPYQPYGQPYGQPMGQAYQPQPYQQPFQQLQLNQQAYQAQTPIVNRPQQITLSTKSHSQEQQFDKFVTAPSAATENVKWLSNDEKGLIDFSDFSSEIKNSQSSPKLTKKQDKGNKITIDAWNW